MKIVSVMKTKSKLTNATRGVPQGSTLGLIFISNNNKNAYYALIESKLREF